jgi:isoleucyl-tRNA synthetase
MSFPAEATIAREVMKFAENGSLYRGSKPVMWSVVEKTALAEAEVEYHDYQSDAIWVKFPVGQGGPEPELANNPLARAMRGDADAVEALRFAANEGAQNRANNRYQGCFVVIWTTTPWTIPGNRAISFSSKITYGLYEVKAAPDGNWAKVETFERVANVPGLHLSQLACAHPLASLGYDFDVPLLDGDHVTDDAGTGFVHTAPGHGADDYIIWTANQKALHDRGIDTTIPFTVDADGVLTAAAPGFTGKRVLKENGDKGDANDAVIKALADAGNIIARARIKHQYPHSWRSKKPVIFRNTPQWFVAMDKPLGAPGDSPAGSRPPGALSNSATLRTLAMKAIDDTEWVPESGRNRIMGMVEGRPDWVLSRQRAWGVPIAVFRNTKTEELAPGPHFKKSNELVERIVKAFHDHGADVWFETQAKERFLKGLVPDKELSDWEQVRDILDVWFDSGSTHAFVLDDAKQFPSLAGIHRIVDGGKDRVMYLEGSDQHRGWFQSSLLESCGTRGRAPFDVVLTHGFILDEKGDEKMSKSKGNVLSPQDVMKQSGADILRLWVASADTTNDIRFGPAIVNAASDAYRKLRNTVRWMLGALAHFDAKDAVPHAQMPELERLMLHRLAELSPEIAKAYAEYDYRKVITSLSHFMNTDLSAFYFDIRKDTLYCEAPSSVKRKAALTVIDILADAIVKWLAPVLSFTAEEAWLARHPGKTSVHIETFPAAKPEWRDDKLAAKWETIRRVRSVVTGALELERAGKRMGSSLEAAPEIHVTDKAIAKALAGIDLAEVCITSAADLLTTEPPEGAFMLPDVPGVAVVPRKAEGAKCARSWRITTDVGSDPRYPDLSARDASAVAEIDALGSRKAGA